MLEGGKLLDIQLELFCLEILSFFAYSPLRLLLDALSPTVSEKIPTASKKATFTLGKKAPIVS